MYFWHFWQMQDVESFQGFCPCPGTAGGAQSTPRPPAAGNNDRWSLHIPHVIYKQQTQGKHTDFDGKTQGKMGRNHQKLGKTQGK